MCAEYSVVARNLNKVYQVPVTEGRRLENLLPVKRRSVHAVKNVSFAARRGQAIGILGKNGSGKSTLLRMLAGIETPTSGSAVVGGTPSLLGVSAALQPKLTGLENIKLGLLAMGVARSDLPAMISEVKNISSLEDEALTRPMNTYSSGMSARLTFAIATSRNPDILMVDEALGTGDATFAETAKRRMGELLDNAGTVFMVSHSAKTLRRTCESALWLHDGRVVMEGALSDISPEYAKWGEATTQKNFDKARQIVESNRKNYVEPVIVFESEAAKFFDNR